MVGTKDPSSKHDFLKDPIQTRVENGWVYANKTTLGADNGIAVAMIMAVFADRSLKHGPLEALITADEETGMEGIQKFDIRKIKAKYLINMDNENDEEICIGCPGNVNIEAELFFKRETRKIPNTTNLKITVTGGVGGHSGQTIAQKRINAIKKIFNTLNFIVDVTDIRLIDIEKAGVARNVIPFECTANINVYKKDVAKVKKIVAHSLRMTHLEYDLEKDMDITCSSSDTKLLPMRKNDSNLVIGVYAGVPNGISTIN
jgi:dipeptidase D